MGYELRLARIGRLSQGVIVLAVATHLLGIEWDPRKLALIAAAIVGGAVLFVGILILQATLAFWTVESLEIANILTYGGVEAAQYPLDIYSRWFRDFLIFVVPIGCVGYFPIVRMLGHRAPLPAPGWLLDAAPLAESSFC